MATAMTDRLLVLAGRAEAATITIDAHLGAWQGQSLVDREKVTDLLLDLRRLLNPGEPE